MGASVGVAYSRNLGNLAGRMSAGPFSAHQASPRELKARIDAERRRAPFLVFRGPDDEQRIFALDQNGGLRVGRDPMCEVCLDQDDQVSR